MVMSKSTESPKQFVAKKPQKKKLKKALDFSSKRRYNSNTAKQNSFIFNTQELVWQKQKLSIVK